MGPLLKNRVAAVQDKQSMRSGSDGPPPRFPDNGPRRRGDGGELPLVKIGDPLRLTYYDSTVDALFSTMDYLQGRRNEEPPAMVMSVIEATIASLDEATRSRICRFALEGPKRELHPITFHCLATFSYLLITQGPCEAWRRSLVKLWDAAGLMMLECELYLSRNRLDTQGLQRHQQPLFAVPTGESFRNIVTDEEQLQATRRKAVRLLQGGAPATLDEYTRRSTSELLLSAPDVLQRREAVRLLYGNVKPMSLNAWLCADKYSNCALAAAIAGPEPFDVDSFVRRDPAGYAYRQGRGMAAKHAQLVHLGVRFSDAHPMPGRPRLMDAVLVALASNLIDDRPGQDIDWRGRERRALEFSKLVLTMTQQGEFIAAGAVQCIADLLLLDHARRHATHLDLANPLGMDRFPSASQGWLRMAAHECEAAVQRLRQAAVFDQTLPGRYGFDQDVLDVPLQLRSIQDAFDARAEAVSMPSRGARPK